MLKDYKGLKSLVAALRRPKQAHHVKDALQALGDSVYSLPEDIQCAVELYVLTLSQDSDVEGISARLQAAVDAYLERWEQILEPNEQPKPAIGGQQPVVTGQQAAQQHGQDSILASVAQTLAGPESNKHTAGENMQQVQPQQNKQQHELEQCQQPVQQKHSGQQQQQSTHSLAADGPTAGVRALAIGDQQAAGIAHAVVTTAAAFDVAARVPLVAERPAQQLPNHKQRKDRIDSKLDGLAGTSVCAGPLGSCKSTVTSPEAVCDRFVVGTATAEEAKAAETEAAETEAEAEAAVTAGINRLPAATKRLPAARSTDITQPMAAGTVSSSKSGHQVAEAIVTAAGAGAAAVNSVGADDAVTGCSLPAAIGAALLARTGASSPLRTLQQLSSPALSTQAAMTQLAIGAAPSACAGTSIATDTCCATAAGSGAASAGAAVDNPVQAALKSGGTGSQAVVAAGQQVSSHIGLLMVPASQDSITHLLPAIADQNVTAATDGTGQDGGSHSAELGGSQADAVPPDGPSATAAAGVAAPLHACTDVSSKQWDLVDAGAAVCGENLVGDAAIATGTTRPAASATQGAPNGGIDSSAVPSAEAAVYGIAQLPLGQQAAGMEQSAAAVQLIIHGAVTADGAAGAIVESASQQGFLGSSLHGAFGSKAPLRWDSLKPVSFMSLARSCMGTKASPMPPAAPASMKLAASGAAPKEAAAAAKKAAAETQPPASGISGQQATNNTQRGQHIVRVNECKTTEQPVPVIAEQQPEQRVVKFLKSRKRQRSPVADTTTPDAAAAAAAEGPTQLKPELSMLLSAGVGSQRAKRKKLKVRPPQQQQGQRAQLLTEVTERQQPSQWQPQPLQQEQQQQATASNKHTQLQDSLQQQELQQQSWCKLPANLAPMQASARSAVPLAQSAAVPVTQLGVSAMQGTCSVSQQGQAMAAMCPNHSRPAAAATTATVVLPPGAVAHAAVRLQQRMLQWRLQFAAATTTAGAAAAAPPQAAGSAPPAAVVISQQPASGACLAPTATQVAARAVWPLMASTAAAATATAGRQGNVSSQWPAALSFAALTAAPVAAAAAPVNSGMHHDIPSYMRLPPNWQLRQNSCMPPPAPAVTAAQCNAIAAGTTAAAAATAAPMMPSVPAGAAIASMRQVVATAAVQPGGLRIPRIVPAQYRQANEAALRLVRDAKVQVQEKREAKKQQRATAQQQGVQQQQEQQQQQQQSVQLEAGTRYAVSAAVKAVAQLQQQLQERCYAVKGGNATQHVSGGACDAPFAAGSATSQVEAKETLSLAPGIAAGAAGTEMQQQAAVPHTPASAGAKRLAVASAVVASDTGAATAATTTATGATSSKGENVGDGKHAAAAAMSATQQATASTPTQSHNPEVAVCQFGFSTSSTGGLLGLAGSQLLPLFTQPIEGLEPQQQHGGILGLLDQAPLEFIERQTQQQQQQSKMARPLQPQRPKGGNKKGGQLQHQPWLGTGKLNHQHTVKQLQQQRVEPTCLDHHAGIKPADIAVAAADSDHVHTADAGKSLIAAAGRANGDGSGGVSAGGTAASANARAALDMGAGTATAPAACPASTPIGVDYAAPTVAAVAVSISSSIPATAEGAAACEAAVAGHEDNEPVADEIGFQASKQVTATAAAVDSGHRHEPNSESATAKFQLALQLPTDQEAAATAAVAATTAADTPATPDGCIDPVTAMNVIIQAVAAVEGFTHSDLDAGEDDAGDAAAVAICAMDGNEPAQPGSSGPSAAAAATIAGASLPNQCEEQHQHKQQQQQQGDVQIKEGSKLWDLIQAEDERQLWWLQNVAGKAAAVKQRQLAKQQQQQQQCQDKQQAAEAACKQFSSWHRFSEMLAESGALRDQAAGPGTQAQASQQHDSKAEEQQQQAVAEVQLPKQLKPGLAVKRPVPDTGGQPVSAAKRQQPTNAAGQEQRPLAVSSLPEASKEGAKQSADSGTKDASAPGRRPAAKIASAGTGTGSVVSLGGWAGETQKSAQMVQGAATAAIVQGGNTAAGGAQQQDTLVGVQQLSQPQQQPGNKQQQKRQRLEQLAHRGVLQQRHSRLVSRDAGLQDSPTRLQLLQAVAADLGYHLSDELLQLLQHQHNSGGQQQQQHPNWRHNDLESTAPDVAEGVRCASSIPTHRPERNWPKPSPQELQQHGQQPHQQLDAHTHKQQRVRQQQQQRNSAKRAAPQLSPAQRVARQAALQQVVDVLMADSSSVSVSASLGVASEGDMATPDATAVVAAAAGGGCGSNSMGGVAGGDAAAHAGNIGIECRASGTKRRRRSSASPSSTAGNAAASCKGMMLSTPQSPSLVNRTFEAGFGNQSTGQPKKGAYSALNVTTRDVLFAIAEGDGEEQEEHSLSFAFEAPAKRLAATATAAVAAGPAVSVAATEAASRKAREALTAAAAAGVVTRGPAKQQVHWQQQNQQQHRQQQDAMQPRRASGGRVVVDLAAGDGDDPNKRAVGPAEVGAATGHRYRHQSRVSLASAAAAITAAGAGMAGVAFQPLKRGRHATAAPPCAGGKAATAAATAVAAAAAGSRTPQSSAATHTSRAEGGASSAMPVEHQRAKQYSRRQQLPATTADTQQPGCAWLTQHAQRDRECRTRRSQPAAGALLPDSFEALDTVLADAGKPTHQQSLQQQQQQTIQRHLRQQQQQLGSVLQPLPGPPAQPVTLHNPWSVSKQQARHLKSGSSALLKRGAQTPCGSSMQHATDSPNPGVAQGRRSSMPELSGSPDNISCDRLGLFSGL